MAKQIKQTKPRNLQDIFNAVIDGSYYTNLCARTNPEGNAIWMCTSLTIACEEEIITAEELNKAKESIDKYLKHLGTSTLQATLVLAGKPSNYEARLAIYRNWAKRPKLHRKSL